MAKIGSIDLGEFPLLLAPMEDVSDPPFRLVCKEYGADMMYTEFISSEGLIRDAAKSKQKLDIFEYERPIGIQLFGSDIESMREAAEIAAQANPDLIDINYGCPVKNVACKGAGAALLQDIPKMVKMTEAIVKCTHLPVTVKTRLGWDDNSGTHHSWQNPCATLQRTSRLDPYRGSEKQFPHPNSDLRKWRCGLSRKGIRNESPIWSGWRDDWQGKHWISLDFQ
jgi:hypothetical protein